MLSQMLLSLSARHAQLASTLSPMGRPHINIATADQEFSGKKQLLNNIRMVRIGSVLMKPFQGHNSFLKLLV
jgi:hypothetical protein